MTVGLARHTLLVAATASLAFPFLAPSPARAHEGEWFVTKRLAERTTNLAFKARDPGTPMSTRCYPWGGSLKPRYPGGPRFYQHFKCVVQIFRPTGTRKVFVTFHVLNKYYALLTEGWAPGGREIGRYRM